MARDYKSEYAEAKERGYYRNRKIFSVTLTGADVDVMTDMLDRFNCMNFPDFIRRILSGDIQVMQRD